MQILVNSDGHGTVDADLSQRLESQVDDELARFREHLTRVEVHVGDEAAGRSEVADMRCTIEARPAGRQPVAVTEHAGSVEEACTGAVRKLARLLQRTFDKAGMHKGGDSLRHLPVEEGPI
ncbi:sigma 54 modulation/S30EA-like ribosomal protein [Kineococcus xinjiangensis]|uniref:Sigma 54 modulation/S30EA-like ribosomal protein n=1 Tax=Kineococcus xinjiangensis TaxID=512762 RepID=A0A2S6IF65_9ACTN|nr:HPF/RaiA family ribosome-associated protein [Kineococcus xinjiangensis]PPK92864.1 sigma 54 modulation/S30EA-like ribosomal protein [Kineococcus xinjiangensis]